MSAFDIEGNALDGGTLKDGEGTVLSYHQDTNLMRGDGPHYLGEPEGGLLVEANYRQGLPHGTYNVSVVARNGILCHDEVDFLGLSRRFSDPLPWVIVSRPRGLGPHL